MNHNILKKQHYSTLLPLFVACIAVVSVITAVGVSDSSDAESGTCGTGVTWTLTGTELTISGTGVMNNYYSSSATPWGTLITKLTVEEGVTSVGSYAFEDCIYLSSVVLPISMKSIGNHAFDSCSSITSIQVPSALIKIGTYAFYKCSSLRSFDFNNSAVVIDEYSFSGCTGLKTVLNVDNVISIGNYAFDNCNQLSSFTMGNSVTSIGNYAFRYCSSITIVDFNKVVTIGDYAFSGCTSLNKVVFHDSTTIIGLYAFSDCKSINSVTFGAGMTSLGNYAFSGCTSLRKLDVPETVSIIPTGLFKGCTALISVGFHDNITLIGDYAFYNCNRLVEVLFPGNLVSIGDYAFYNCNNLTNLVIPDNVTKIGAHSFASCDNLQSYTMSKALSTLGEYAFDDNYYGRYIYSADGSDTTISATIFAGGHFQKDSDENYWKFVGGISGDLNWSISDGILTFSGTGESASYGSSAFLPWGKSYTKLNVEPGVTKLGCYMFNGCSALTEVSIADTVTTIEENAFGNASFCDYTGTTVLDATAANLSGHTFVGSNYNLQMMRNGYTVIYKYADGTKAAEDVYQDISVGTEYSITSPPVTGYTPSVQTVSGTLIKASEWTVVTYNIDSHTLTVHYVYADGSTAKSDYSGTYKYNVDYSVSVSSIYGYSSDKDMVTGTMGAADIEVKVTYSPNEYDLTVHYYYNGSSIADDYTTKVLFGESYSVTSPEVQHYSPRDAVVSGKMDQTGKTVTVYYSPIYYTLTIEKKDTDGNKIDEDYTTSVAYGRTYSCSPAVTGYTITSPVSGTMDSEGKTEICIYTANTYTVSITYTLAETGREIDTVENKVAFGTDYSFQSPTLAGYSPSKEKVEGKMSSSDLSFNVVYYINSYNVNVNYVYQDGTKAAEPYAASFVYGKTFVITSPRVFNYSADLTAVSGTMGASDLTFEVVYYPNTYHVTVYYVYSDGTAAADTNTVEVAYGKAYSIASPVLAGYVADQNTIAGTIGAADVSYNVVYFSSGRTSSENGDSSGSSTNTILIAAVGVIAAMSLACSILVLRKH